MRDLKLARVFSVAGMTAQLIGSGMPDFRAGTLAIPGLAVALERVAAKSGRAGEWDRNTSWRGHVERPGYFEHQRLCEESDVWTQGDRNTAPTFRFGMNWNVEDAGLFSAFRGGTRDYHEQSLHFEDFVSFATISCLHGSGLIVTEDLFGGGIPLQFASQSRGN